MQIYHPLCRASCFLLLQLRKSGNQIGSQTAEAPANPPRNDPFVLFGHYPTWLLAPDTLIAKSPTATEKRLAHVAKSQIATFGTQLTYPGEKLVQLLESLPPEQTVTVQDLCSRVPAAEGRSLLFSILWLSKNGMLRLLPKTVQADTKKSELVV